MTSGIRRYVVDVDRETDQAIPIGTVVQAAIMVDQAPQDDQWTKANVKLEVWVLHNIVNNDIEPGTMQIRVYDTNKAVPTGWTYQTTCAPFYLPNGNKFVGHVFKQ